MSPGKKLLVVLLVLVTSGFALRPFDDSLRRDLEEARLLYDPLDLDTREKIGQVSFAIVLGGLRSFIAAMMNVTDVQRAWSRQQWFEVDEAFRTIVVLQPRTRYYWQAASQHLALNAWADYADRPGMTDEQREDRQHEVLAKGKEYLARGMENLPEDWRLAHDLASLHEHPHRPPNNLPAAAELYRSAAELPGAPKFLRRRLFYVLNRLPERRTEAYHLSRELMSDEHHRRIPSVQTQTFALQQEFAPEDERTSLTELFGSRAQALRSLSHYWRRRDEGYPMTGVAETVRELLTEFEIPEEFSPLRKPRPGEGPWRRYPDEILERLRVPSP